MIHLTHCDFTLDRRGKAELRIQWTKDGRDYGLNRANLTPEAARYLASGFRVLDLLTRFLAFAETPEGAEATMGSFGAGYEECLRDVRCFVLDGRLDEMLEDFARGVEEEA